MASTPRQLSPTDPIPPHGSVVLLHGLTGTAYQRFYTDGLFHGVGAAGGREFADLFSMGSPHDRVFLVYETPEEA